MPTVVGSPLTFAPDVFVVVAICTFQLVRPVFYFLKNFYFRGYIQGLALA